MVVGISLNWAPAPVSTLGPLLFLGTFVLISYLLLGPYYRRTRSLPGEQRLLFDKLRNLLLLVWVFYIVGTIIASSRLGLLDQFTTVLIATYVDLVLLVTIGSIVLRSDDAMASAVDGERGAPPEDAGGGANDGVTGLVDRAEGLTGGNGAK